MVTFLAGGTGTPKLLAGARELFDPAESTVVCNTGDDVELGGLLVCPDVDTVLFEGSGRLDRETWWGIEDDTTETHAELHALAAAAALDTGPQYLSADRQTTGRTLANWRRFSGVGEFMQIGDRDRALHITRTSLLDSGQSLTDVTTTLADAYGLDMQVLPMSDDPVASIIHTPEGPLHFQAFWVGYGGEPSITDVEFRGADSAQPTTAVLDAIRTGPVIIGPSNPVTSLGPMLALEGVRDALADTTVVAVSPFIEDQLFSGPADDLMAATGTAPSTAGVAERYPFVDAFVLDTDDDTCLDRPVVRTDTAIDSREDSLRVTTACRDAVADA